MFKPLYTDILLPMPKITSLSHTTSDQVWIAQDAMHYLARVIAAVAKAQQAQHGSSKSQWGGVIFAIGTHFQIIIQKSWILPGKITVAFLINTE